ncbi:MAG: hypothetical protein U9N53_15525 [Bacteroidota bacterium]|nr:hypothetical protein [Bacteroidota bacterium]
MLDFLKKYLFFGFVFFSFSLTLSGQIEDAGDSLVTIQCQLKSLTEEKPIVYAHILNSGLNIGTTSDTLGFFTIVMRRSDSLFISALGFNESYFSLPGFWPSNHFSGVIHVRQKVYMIDPVSVEGFGNYAQFRRKVISSIPPKTPTEESLEYIQEITREEAIKYDKVNVGFNFSIKTKEEKSLIKLQKILDYQLKQKIIREKFNEENVGELTGLKGQELKDFMNYCNLSEEFLLNASEYDILYMVKGSYWAYRRDKK